jgi:hypothetical protein
MLTITAETKEAAIFVVALLSEKKGRFTEKNNTP